MEKNILCTLDLNSIFCTVSTFLLYNNHCDKNYIHSVITRYIITSNFNISS